MNIHPLCAGNPPRALGAEVLDLDLSIGLGADEMTTCVNALCAHRVLIFRQQKLTPERFLAFGRRWGAPVPHVSDHLRMHGHPEIMQIGNIGKTCAGDQVHPGADYWHTDQSYDAEPVSATMLYSVLVPDKGGETLFADLAAAYAALPVHTKSRIHDLIVNHRYGAASGGKVTANSEDQPAEVPTVQHPLVRTHPLSGRQTLYAICGTPESIEGMPQDEAQALLEVLRTHALDERFVYHHLHREGDITLYDPTATLHAATTIPPAAGLRDRRLLWRVTVHGRPAGF